MSHTNVLNWKKIVFLLVFLNSLITIPTSLYLYNIDSYPFESLYPASFEVFSKMAITEPGNTLNVTMNNEDNSNYNIINTLMDEKDQWVIDNRSNESSDQTQFTIIVEEDGMSFTENSLPVLQLASIQPQSLFNSDGTVINQINSAIYNEYRPIIMILITLIVSIVSIITLSFILVGSTVIILKPLKSVLQIYTVKSAVTLVIYCLGLPVLIVSLVGLLFYDITVTFALLTGGYSLMFLLTYYQAFTKSFEMEKEIQ